MRGARGTGPALARVSAAMLCLGILGIAACGSGSPRPSASTTTTERSSSTTGSTTAALPGTGKPEITIGDKNYTEQFVLGELYRQALTAQGYGVYVNRNIGPTEVTIPAVESGRVDLYPEYLTTWDTAVAGVRRPLPSARAAYQVGQQYALAHGLQLLNPTPFADSAAIVTTRSYAAAHDLRSLDDLRRVGATLTLGGPPQFQQDPSGLPALQQAYGFAPAVFTPLGVGTQYMALDQGKVQAADVNTTDGQLAGGKYVLLRDPRRVFGWGSAVPVVSAAAMLAEGPTFTATIDRVDRLLSTKVMRRLNAAVDLSGQTPEAVATQFLQTHGLLTAATP